MKIFVKKSYLIFLFIALLLFNNNAFSKSNKIEYSKDAFSNYLSGVIFAKQNYTNEAFKHLKKVQFLKKSQSNYNIEFIRTLILLDKFEQAFTFSKSIWDKEVLFFEVDLLLGLNYFIEKDYVEAEKHFKRLNNISRYNLFFEDLFGNILISWIEALKNNKNNSFKLLDEIPDHYDSLKQIQNSFLQCYFDEAETIIAFKKITESKNSSFSRYNFFLINYLLYKNKNDEAKKVLQHSRELYNSNLLLRQVENFIFTKNSNKIKNFFNCKNPKDNIAEIFYVIANLYSTQDDYQLSNFYLKISLFLNDKFTPNKSLLAENLFYQKKYKYSQKVNSSLKSIGSVYSWYAARRTAIILLDTEDKKNSIASLQNEFNLLSNPNYQHYYELANFYKENEYYEQSIKYYSLALDNITEGHFLISKILDRRGTSYERLGDWEKAEKDLLESLDILPDQPHVLNYLAYSWVDKGMNINKALEMLERAIKLTQNDGYIIDSMGWAYYMNKNYSNAEKYLQRAVEILPLDPIINDHYADTLWMLEKDIQARYFWKHVLSLDTIEQELRDKVNKKIIFGINKEL